MFLEGLWLSVFVVSVFKQQLRIRDCATCSCLTFSQKPPLDLLIFLLETAACIKRCRNAEWKGTVAAQWTLGSCWRGLVCWRPWKELMGMDVDIETCTSYGRGTARPLQRLLLFENTLCAGFVQCSGMGGCLGPAWGVFSDSFHGVFSWAFPQPSKIKHDNLFPWHIWELPVLRLPWAFHFQAFLLWRVLQEHILEAFVMQSCYSWNNIAL